MVLSFRSTNSACRAPWVPAMRRYEKLDLVVKIVRCRQQSDLRDSLLCLGQFGQHRSNRVAVGPDQPPGPQLGAAEITGNDDGRVAQTASLQDRQRRPAGRARWLAVVVAVGGDGRTMPDDVGWHIVTGIGELSFHLIDEGSGLLDAEDRGDGSDKARIDDPNLNPASFRWDYPSFHRIL